jgi:hypothetical protein
VPGSGCFFDDAFVKRLHLDVATSIFARIKFNLVGARPIFENGEVRRDQHGGKFSRSPITTAVPMKRVQLQRILDRLGAMNFPPEVLIRSFLRSVIERNPSLSRSPMSPVLNQPSTKARAFPRDDSNSL